MEALELMSGDHFHVILHGDKEHGLIFNRLDGTITTIYYNDAKELSNLKSMGFIYGVVGRFLDKYLILIKSCSKVGSLYESTSKQEHDIFVITQVQVIDISHKSTSSAANSSSQSSRNDSVKYEAKLGLEEGGNPLEEFRNNNDDFSSLPVTISTNSYNSAQSHANNNNWNPFKLANSLRPKVASQFLKSTPSDQPQSSSGGGGGGGGCSDGQSSQSLMSSIQGDADKRLVEEMIKLFNNTNSFYFSPTLDLTKRFSTRTLVKKAPNESIWATADERFFWNKYMLKDLIELSKEDSDANYFITVILQGFVSIEEHNSSPPKAIRNLEELDGEIENGVSATSMNFLGTSTLSSSGGNVNNCDRQQQLSDEHIDVQQNDHSKTYQMALISRRSVFQAGTRYRRRGCDEQGNCANYVETEQIFRCNQHFKSLVILRGSIPLFWFQSGYNYRPPPVLIRSDEENSKAFRAHFENLIRFYGTEHIIGIDCTEQTGREKNLHDAYKRHMEILAQLYPKIKLIEFDFHKHCRGRQCTDTQIERHLKDCGLTEQLMKDVKYYWNDGEIVWEQDGLFRVNCIDCSDRTNVVQRSIALKILDIQMARLGVITPDTSPENNECRKIMQRMWTANGNVLSTQYCGTRALFNGDRRLAGYLKDTYSSASRYYIGKFRDVYRQAAIDAMLGVESVDSSELKSGNLIRDQYELLNFDPIIANSRTAGSALLKDVGNRFSNRLARLKGKFYVRPGGFIRSAEMGAGRMRHSTALEATPEILETGLIDTLGEMSIDWPSSESLGQDHQRPSTDDEPVGPQDVFARFTNCEDSFQDDDEFGQLMLSIDLAELQRLRDHEQAEEAREGKNSMPNNDSKQKQEDTKSEEINMTEARAIRPPQSSSEEQSNHIGDRHHNPKVNTTST